MSDGGGLGARVRHVLSSPTRVTVLGLTAVMSLDTSDQSAIGATAPQVRAAFGISSTQIGVIATSSTLVGVLFTLPFGIAADRTNRIRVLRATVIVWTLAVIAVGAAPNFLVMLLAHSVLGLVTGAAPPLIASMVGDMVPEPRRGRVYSVLLLGELVGSVLGLALPGEIAALVGWRWAFWSLAVGGVLVLILLRWAVEPPRRSPPRRVRRRGPAGEAAAQPPQPPTQVPLGEAIASLLRNRTNVLLVLASAAGYYFFAGVQTFAVSLLREAYGVSAASAPVLVLLIGLSLAIGVLIGGPLGDRMLRTHARFGRLPVLLVAFGGSLLLIFPGLASSDLKVTMPLLVAGGVLLGSANPPLDATRISIVAGALLGRAEALRNSVRDGADATAPLAFGALGAAFGLHQTFLVMTASLGLALVLCALATRSYPADARAAGLTVETT